jgi:hypothetical protein
MSTFIMFVTNSAYVKIVDPDRVGNASFCRIRIGINASQAHEKVDKLYFISKKNQYAVQNT